MLHRLKGRLGLRQRISGVSFWTTFLPHYLSALQVKQALALTRSWADECLELQAQHLKSTREEQYQNRVLIEDALESLEAKFYQELFEGILAVHVDLSEGRMCSPPLLTPEQQYGYSELARHWLGYRFRGIFQRKIFGDCDLVTGRAYLMLERYLSHISAPEAAEPDSLL